MTTDRLRAERDAAFAAYLAARRAKRPHRALLLALIAITRQWYREAKMDAVIQRAKERRSA